MAEAYHQLDLKDSSRNAYLNAVKELPDYPDAWLGIGESYYSSEDWIKAIEFIKTGLEKPIPKTKSAIDYTKYLFRPLVFMALSYVKIGRSQDGYAWFKKAKDSNPNHPWVKEYDSLFEEMRELDEYVRSFVKLGQIANKHYPETLPKIAQIIPLGRS